MSTGLEDQIASISWLLVAYFFMSDLTSSISPEISPCLILEGTSKS